MPRIMVGLQRAAVRGGVDLLEDVQGPVSTARGAVLALHAASGVGESHTTVVNKGVAAYIILSISDIGLTVGKQSLTITFPAILQTGEREPSLVALRDTVRHGDDVTSSCPLVQSAVRAVIRAASGRPSGRKT